MKVADLELDVVRHRATRASPRLDLTPKDFALLSLLARRTGEVRSRTLIASQVRIGRPRSPDFTIDDGREKKGRQRLQNP